MRRLLIILLRVAAGILLVVAFALALTSLSPIYNFAASEPFSGPDIFDPYRHLDAKTGWKRTNFHTHTRVDGIFNECEFYPDDVLRSYEKFDYDIVTFSNHNALTEHPRSDSLQVNVYEHGYNLFKYHKLVFGCSKVCPLDNLLPLFASQRQTQIDILSAGADLIQLNHPFRTNMTSRSIMESLEGYGLIELDSGVSQEQEYWDWALSAGHYSFATASDDLHYPDRHDRIAVRCSFLNCPSARYDSILHCLRDGAFYCMRVPDYGDGSWSVKYEKNRTIPKVDTIGLSGSTVFISLSRKASRIVVTGAGHTTLKELRDTNALCYAMQPCDSYARLTAWFDDGAVIYSNPFARYDSSKTDSPFRPAAHSINWVLTVIFNLLIVLLAGVIVKLFTLLLKPINNED